MDNKIEKFMFYELYKEICSEWQKGILLFSIGQTLLRKLKRTKN